VIQKPTDNKRRSADAWQYLLDHGELAVENCAPAFALTWHGDGDSLMSDNQSARRKPERQISPERKSLYYLGNTLAIIGLLSFLSVFLSAAINFGDFTDFHSQGQSMAFRAFGGFVLIFLGGAIARIGSAGVAGSGLKLDPEQARRDQEPWSRLTGGVVRDVLDEAGINLGGNSTQQSAEFEMPFDEKLRRLHKLREDGILTDEEYQREKQQLLDRT
jgi:hypothetical protein